MVQGLNSKRKWLTGFTPAWDSSVWYKTRRKNQQDANVW